MSWTAVVPVRSWVDGKTRLGTSALMRSFTTDLVTALAGSHIFDQIVVTSADPHVKDWAEHHQVAWVRDREHELNRALVAASPAGSVAYFLADLPCVRIDDLRRLWEHITGPSFVSDTGGTGTTCAIFPAGSPLTPAFGPRSRAGHRALGLREITEQDVGIESACRLRRDVDTPVDLWDAIRLGVGQHTRTSLEELTP